MKEWLENPLKLRPGDPHPDSPNWFLVVVRLPKGDRRPRELNADVEFTDRAQILSAYFERTVDKCQGGQFGFNSAAKADKGAFWAVIRSRQWLRSIGYKLRPQSKRDRRAAKKWAIAKVVTDALGPGAKLVYGRTEHGKSRIPPDHRFALGFDFEMNEFPADWEIEKWVFLDDRKGDVAVQVANELQRRANQFHGAAARVACLATAEPRRRKGGRPLSRRAKTVR